jgi:NTE family protein
VETRALVKSQMQQLEQQMHDAGYDVHFYFAEVDFSSIDSPGLQQYFNNLPTTLELSNEEVDTLIAAGRLQLRKSKPYQEFMARNHGQLHISPDEKPTCTLFDPVACLQK